MASNRRCRCQFRYRGSRRESAVAQLFSLGIIEASHEKHRHSIHCRSANRSAARSLDAVEQWSRGFWGFCSGVYETPPSIRAHNLRLLLGPIALACALTDVPRWIYLPILITGHALGYL
jgi:hypothetical protein